MPTLSAGRASNRARGVTLIEMLIVMAIIGLVASIAFPSVSSGLESLRLSSATNSVVTFLNGALNRAERREDVMEVIISARDNALWMYSATPGFERKLELPEGVRIQAIYPEVPQAPSDAPRRFLLMPGGVTPGIGVQLVNRRGARRIVRVDPITGVPRVEILETESR
jgi:prepilin-type N-terminal cleavage/methylation domain-containing protein